MVGGFPEAAEKLVHYYIYIHTFFPLLIALEVVLVVVLDLVLSNYVHTVLGDLEVHKRTVQK